MEDKIIQIPFSNFGKSGVIEVVYKENTSPVTSGFEIVKEIENPNDIYYEVDVTPTMKKNGLPFCAYGFPADFYDAPCNTYFNGAKLIWKADTFFVSMPSYLNNESISFLAGFQWGFIDYNNGENKHIDITPMRSIESTYWEKHISLFNGDFPKWNFDK